MVTLGADGKPLYSVKIIPNTIALEKENKELLKKIDEINSVHFKYVVAAAKKELALKAKIAKLEKEINKLSEADSLAKRYAQLRMTGAKTEEDLKIQWVIETARIKLPDNP